MGLRDVMKEKAVEVFREEFNKLCEADREAIKDLQKRREEFMRRQRE